ncbi:hypothetical protein HKD37_11G032333 [Glycine soja]
MLISILARDINLASNRNYESGYIFFIKVNKLDKMTNRHFFLSISIIQLWILHITETSMQAGNANLYEFLKPQSIQRSGQSQFESESYIKNWMQSSTRCVPRSLHEWCTLANDRHFA